jgi:hypothetical protein
MRDDRIIFSATVQMLEIGEGGRSFLSNVPHSICRHRALDRVRYSKIGCDYYIGEQRQSLLPRGHSIF